MAFYRNPIIEEPPRCIVCSVVVTDGSLICSATCADLYNHPARRFEPLMDWEDEYANC